MNEKEKHYSKIYLFIAVLLIALGGYLFGRSHGHTEGRAEFESVRAELRAAREINSGITAELEDYRRRLQQSEITVTSVIDGNTVLTDRLIDDRGKLEEVGSLASENRGIIDSIRAEIRKGNQAP
jgi:hypothetical protein